MAEVKNYLELAATPSAEAGFPWVGASGENLKDVKYYKTNPATAE